MMVEPHPAVLIRRICDSLELAGQAGVPPSQRQRQLKAGLWALRYVASRLKGRHEIIAVDIEEMELLVETFADLVPLSGNFPIEAEPRHLALQQCVAELDAAAQVVDADERRQQAMSALRAMYLRMAQRERLAGE